MMDDDGFESRHDYLRNYHIHPAYYRLLLSCWRLFVDTGHCLLPWVC